MDQRGEGYGERHGGRGERHLPQAVAAAAAAAAQPAEEVEVEPTAVRAVKLLQSMQAMTGLDVDGPAKLQALTTFQDLFLDDPTQAISFIPYLLSFDGTRNQGIKLVLIRLIEHAVCRAPSAPYELKTMVLVRGVQTLAKFLMDPHLPVKKRAVLCCTNLYPEAFKYLCLYPQDQVMASFIPAIKLEIRNFLGIPNEGLRIYVAKFLIKQIIVQSPRGTIDEVDVSSDMCPVDHPYLNRLTVEVEAADLLGPLLSLLESEQVHTSLMVSIISSLLLLVTRRHQFLQPVVLKLIELSRAQHLHHITLGQRQDVLRSIRLVLLSFFKLKDITSYKSAITDTLKSLNANMEDIRRALEDGARMGAQGRGGFGLHPDANRKGRKLTASEEAHYLATTILKNLDIPALPVSLVVEVLMSGLQNASYLDLREGFMRVEQQHLSLEQKRQADLAMDPRLRDPRYSASALGSKGPVLPETYMYHQPAVQPFLTQVLEIVTRLNAESGAVAAEMSEDTFAALVQDDLDARMVAPTLLEPAQQKVVLAEAIDRILRQGEALFAGTSSITPTNSSHLVPNTAGAAKTAWMLMVARLTGPDRALLGPAKQGAEGDTSFAAADRDTKQVLLDFILEDFRERYELAVLWLHQEVVVDDRAERQWRERGCSEPAPIPEYPHWFHALLDALATSLPAEGAAMATTPATGTALLDPLDRTFTKFLIDVPLVTDHAIEDVLRSYCLDVERMQLGISTCRDLLKLRPSVEEPCFALLLELCRHATKAIRATAIITVKRFFAEHATWGPRIEEVAVGYLQGIAELPFLPPPLVAEGADAQAADGMEGVEAADGAGAGQTDAMEGVSTTPSATSGGQAMDADGNELPAVSPGEEAKAAHATALAARETELHRHLDLYLTLCTRKPALLTHLFRLYPAQDPGIQDLLRTQVQSTVLALATHGLLEELAPVLHDVPPGSEELMHRMLVVVGERVTPPAVLVEAAKHVISQRALDARYLIPILPGLSKEEILLNLPVVVDLLDSREAQRALLKGVFMRLVETSKNVLVPAAEGGGTEVVHAPALTAVELLVQLHRLEDAAVELKKMIEAITICLTTPTIFTQQVLAAALQQLLQPPVGPPSDATVIKEQQPTSPKLQGATMSQPERLPTLFMRTLIQSVVLFPGLEAFAVGALTSLIPRKVWTDGRAWEGYVRCLTHLFPKSLPLLTTLPAACSRDALQRSVRLRDALTAYLGEADAAGTGVVPGLPSLNQRKALRRLLE